jgi:hypothetical protein
MYSFSGNCAASVPNSKFMNLWAIYLFPGSVHIFGCSKIDRPVLEIYKSLTDMSVWTEREISIILFWKYKPAQFHFWEYMNGNQTFILDSHPDLHLYSGLSAKASLCLPSLPAVLPANLLSLLSTVHRVICFTIQTRPSNRFHVFPPPPPPPTSKLPICGMINNIV